MFVLKICQIFIRETKINIWKLYFSKTLKIIDDFFREKIIND